MSDSLYVLTGQMLQLQEMLYEEDADEQVILDTMEGLDYEIEQKADGYAMIIQKISGDVEAIDKEIDRLQARKKSLKGNIERLKNNLEGSMIALDKRKFKTALFSFGIQKNPPSVDIVGDVPDEYLIAQEPKVDKKAIIAFVKEHGDTEYAHLKQTEGLRIR